MPVVPARAVVSRTAEIVLIVVFFLLTVWLRAGELDRTLSGGQEWLTAQTMIVHDIWYRDGGPAASYFGMRMTYPLEADKYINNASMGNHYPGYPHDGDGNYYYMSHATLGVVAPYLVVRALGQGPSVLAVQVFNLGIHLLCALLLYACVRAAAPMSGRFHVPAVLAGIVYLTVPVALWFHANVYFVEIFVQLPFIAAVLATLLYVRHRDTGVGPSTVRLWLVGALVGVACLSEWLGYPLALTIAAAALIPGLAGRDPRLAATAIGGAAVGGGLFFLQHSLIVGPVAFTNHLLQQFLYRTWTDDSGDPMAGVCVPFVDYGNIPGYYLDGFRPAFPLIVGLAIVAAVAFLHARKVQAAEPGRYRLILLLLFLVAVPPLMHHLLLPGFTAQHSYAVLKAAFLFGAVAAALSYAAQRVRPTAILVRIGLPLALIALAPASVSGYRAFAGVTAGGISIYTKPIAAARSEARDDEVLFLVEPCMARPQMLHLMGRNVQIVGDANDAREWLHASPNTATRGIVLFRARSESTRVSMDDD